MAVYKEFKPTFKKYDKMTKAEQNAFKQGSVTAKNRAMEALGFRQKKNK